MFIIKSNIDSKVDLISRFNSRYREREKLK